MTDTLQDSVQNLSGSAHYSTRLVGKTVLSCYGVKELIIIIIIYRREYNKCRVYLRGKRNLSAPVQPSCLQTVLASFGPKFPHTDPHVPLQQTSTRPCDGYSPSLSLSCPSYRDDLFLISTVMERDNCALLMLEPANLLHSTATSSVCVQSCLPIVL